MRLILGLSASLVLAQALGVDGAAIECGRASESLASQAQVKVMLNSNAWKQELQAWTLGSSQGVKTRVQLEQDPLSSKVSRFEGYALLDVLDRTMEPLTVEQRASVDLIVLRDARGTETAMPRWLPTKYMILLAYSRDKAGLQAEGPFYLVMPWTTQSKIRKEPLPLEKFFIPNVASIELTNMKQFYGKDFFLQSRSDPMPIRGEKRYVQSCMPCHRMQDLPQVRKISESIQSRETLDRAHSKTQGFSSLDEKEHRALLLYMDQLLQTEAPKKRSFF